MSYENVPSPKPPQTPREKDTRTKDNPHRPEFYIPTIPGMIRKMFQFSSST